MLRLFFYHSRYREAERDGMTSTENIVPTHADASGSRSVDGDYIAFRRQIRLGAISLLVVNLVVGLFARQQHHTLFDYAINVYDTAFISTNYTHFAQVSFQRYVDERLSATTPEERSKAAEGLGNVLDNLDVAIERSYSPSSRDLAKEIRTKIAGLAGGEHYATELKPELINLQQQLERLRTLASDFALQARDDIQGFSSKSDTLLAISIGSSIVVVMVGLLLFERLISQAQAARRNAEQSDAEMATTAKELGVLREKALAAKSMQADRMSEVLNRFMREMTEPMESLHVAAKDLNLSAENLSEMARQAKTDSATVASVSEATATIVQSAAAAGEQLAQTIAEVENHAIESSRLAADAVNEVVHTNSTIDELAVVTKEISEVTALINKIAGQTSLLALNATIESARAGEAGRGFSVVAHEVKTLAAQTANATRDISKRIEAIQNVAHRSVAAIQGISHTIRDLDRFSVRIASAVEQQTEAAREIASNLTSASANVVNVNGAITKVESVGVGTAQAAEMLTSASANVTKQAKRIHEQVRDFTEDIRAIQGQYAS
jgi:methyl-accepting chemotaxis protein